MPETYKEHEYNGKPMIKVLLYIEKDGTERWFSFGVVKANAILNNVEAIRRFAAKNSK
ncbi:MAG: hypothetical protein JW943_07460 [Deltaproteobacteria bacterium]|nr:hypothetical protein [Deltaproteobacteria bacterium]